MGLWVAGWKRSECWRLTTSDPVVIPEQCLKGAKTLFLYKKTGFVLALQPFIHYKKLPMYEHDVKFPSPLKFSRERNMYLQILVMEILFFFYLEFFKMRHEFCLVLIQENSRRYEKCSVSYSWRDYENRRLVFEYRPVVKQTWKIIS